MNSHSYSFKQSGLSKRALKAPTAKNAERERSRVRSLRSAFQTLQSCLPSVPPDTKLSKLDILILATNYIVQLTKTLEGDNEINQMLSRPNSPIMCSVRPVRSDRCLKYYHPIKKWPMRSRLYSLMNTDRLIEPDCNNNAQLEYRYLAFEKTTIDR